MLKFLENRSETQRDEAVENLISESTPRNDYFMMIFLAVSMATFGLITDNASVVIGSMLIAPLLSPILELGMGLVMTRPKLILRSSFTVAKSVLIAVPTATLITVLFSRMAGLDHGLNAEILARLRPDAISGMIALVSGIAASYSLLKPHLNASLPGVAVSASLVPPLAVTGIGAARLDWTVVSKSFALFLINAVLIVLASSVVFAAMHLRKKQAVADKAVKKEDALMEMENEEE